MQVLFQRELLLERTLVLTVMGGNALTGSVFWQINLERMTGLGQLRSDAATQSKIR